MRGTRLSGGFYACEGVDTSLMTAWSQIEATAVAGLHRRADLHKPNILLQPGMLSLDRRNRNRSTIGRAPCSRAAVLTLETPSKRSKTGRLSFVAAALFETY